jgi:hypothetical protein
MATDKNKLDYMEQLLKIVERDIRVVEERIRLSEEGLRRLKQEHKSLLIAIEGMRKLYNEPKTRGWIITDEEGI